MSIQEYKMYNDELDSNSNVVREFHVVYQTKFRDFVSASKPLTDSSMAYDYIMNCGIYNKELCEINSFEKFGVILLNVNNHPKGYCLIGVGGINEMLVDIRKIAFYAVSTMSTSVILFHNHPSGNATFSEKDKSLTHDVIEALKMFRINVLDHLVVTDRTYQSYIDNL